MSWKTHDEEIHARVREVIRRMSDGDATPTLAEIAKVAEVSRMTVHRIRRKMVLGGNLPKANVRPRILSAVDHRDHERVELPAPRREMPDPRPRLARDQDSMAEWLPAARRAILGLYGATIRVPATQEGG